MKTTFYLLLLGFGGSLMLHQHSSHSGLGRPCTWSKHYTWTSIKLSPLILVSISPPAFLPLFFLEIHLRSQTPPVQLAVLLLSEVWFTVKIVTLFQSFHQKLIGLLKRVVDTCSSKFNLSSQAGGMRRRGKDIRNSLGKQVIRTVSLNYFLIVGEGFLYLHMAAKQLAGSRTGLGGRTG